MDAAKSTQTAAARCCNRLKSDLVRNEGEDGRSCNRQEKNKRNAEKCELSGTETKETDKCF